MEHKRAIPIGTQSSRRIKPKSDLLILVPRIEKDRTNNQLWTDWGARRPGFGVLTAFGSAHVHSCAHVDLKKANRKRCNYLSDRTLACTQLRVKTKDMANRHAIHFECRRRKAPFVESPINETPPGPHSIKVTRQSHSPSQDARLPTSINSSAERSSGRDESDQKPALRYASTYRCWSQAAWNLAS